MGELRFDEQASEFRRPPEAVAGFDMAAHLIKWGVAPDRKQAEYILIGVAIFALAMAVFVWFVSSGSGTSQVTRTQMDVVMRAGSQNIVLPETPASGI